MSLVGPVYLSEVSPSAVRGRLSSAIQLFIVSGLLSMYLVASFLTWKWLALFGMVFPSITVILLLLSVESPAWYFNRQLDSKATRVGPSRAGQFHNLLQNAKTGIICAFAHLQHESLKAQKRLFQFPVFVVPVGRL